MADGPTIWIEEGCIQCGWCENLEPRVFQVTAGGCEIRAEARSDGARGANRGERSAVPPALLVTEEAIFLRFVSDGCPAQVIRFSGLPDDVMV